MKTILALLAAALVALATLTLLPDASASSDCNGCGPHKSKVE